MCKDMTTRWENVKGRMKYLRQENLLPHWEAAAKALCYECDHLQEELEKMAVRIKALEKQIQRSR